MGYGENDRNFRAELEAAEQRNSVAQRFRAKLKVAEERAEKAEREAAFLHKVIEDDQYLRDNLWAIFDTNDGSCTWEVVASGMSTLVKERDALRDALFDSAEVLESVWAAIGDALCSGKGITRGYSQSVASKASTAAEKAREIIGWKRDV